MYDENLEMLNLLKKPINLIQIPNQWSKEEFWIEDVPRIDSNVKD